MPSCMPSGMMDEAVVLFYLSYCVIQLHLQAKKAKIVVFQVVTKKREGLF